MFRIILLTIILTSIFLYGCNNGASPSAAPNTNTNEPSVDNTQPTTPPAVPEVQTPPTVPTVTPPPVAPTDNKPAESANQSVTIQGFAFNPSALTVSVGTTVSWTNEDSAPHDIKFPDFTSPLMGNGQSFDYKFEPTGTYDYSCGVHPSMKGQIIVK